MGPRLCKAGKGAKTKRKRKRRQNRQIGEALSPSAARSGTNLETLCLLRHNAWAAPVCSRQGATLLYLLPLFSSAPAWAGCWPHLPLHDLFAVGPEGKVGEVVRVRAEGRDRAGVQLRLQIVWPVGDGRLEIE